jgi:hypothetical protein
LKRWLFSVAGLLGALVAAQPVVVPAASNGMAWDSVMKFVPGADTSNLQPGSFDSDFAAASAVQTEDQGGGGGGIFGKLKQAMAMGKNAEQMLQNGFAQHHYVAGYKERVDQIGMQTATITDCSARTITTLDLRHKTYTVVSMDAPRSSDGSGGDSSAPHPMASNDLSHLSIAVQNTALGPRTIAGTATSGYRSDTTITATKSNGETSTTQAQMTGYYAAFQTPRLACSTFGSGSPMGPGMGQGAQSMQQYGQLMRASSNLDKRFSITQSGPALPIGHFSLFDAVTFQGKSGNAAAFENERGNVRSIAASDPIFSVPSDFTQQQPPPQ